MSGAGFHVHGPHEHELEHAAQSAHEPHGASGTMINQIAMSTAIIATVGAIFSYMGGWWACWPCCISRACLQSLAPSWAQE